MIQIQDQGSGIRFAQSQIVHIINMDNYPSKIFKRNNASS